MTELPPIEVFDSPAAAADAAAGAILDGLVHAISERGHGNLAVTGGSSPGPVYDRLADAALAWPTVNLTLTDERWVDPASEQSNERLVRRRLLCGPAGQARFVPLKSDGADIDAAAWSADLAVSALIPFDVALLGMGEDGHVCSLFPGSPILADGLDPASARLVLAAPPGVPAPPQPRLTLTLAALASARLILILTTGAAKRAVLEGAPDKPVHHLIAAARGEVRLLWSA